MKGIYFVLTGLALFGFLPLAIILYKRRRVNRVLTTGRMSKARVYGIHTVRRQPTDIVYYTFYDQHMKQFNGSLTCKSGLYKMDDVIDVYYDPGNPKLNTVNGAWQSNFILGFGIALAAFILFAVYKLYEMIESGEA
ncbi:MAG TPA: hypothetical protein PLV32_05165 [Chitinophagaceae bacterium]|nr:hypothetical protein [Chitinophagaceae bacterium]